MSEQKLVSPLLDGFVMGSPMSSHDGVVCCPAMKENTDEKYIVKIISVPASQVQLDALLLTGAYKDPADAMDYFEEVADGIAAEADTLNTLSKLDGFLPFDGIQIVPMEDGKLGYEVHLLSPYKRSLLRHMRKNPVTHLEAVNLGLDLCAALAICRRAGYLYVDLKPANVFISREKQYRIGDLGFVKLDSLSYTSLPGKYRSGYSPREVQDDLKTLNETVDTYAVGMILYQIYNEGSLPALPLEPKDAFPHPSNADYEISSIIMKALDPDPAKRWANPMEMGQALVGYLQRNSVNNTPIAPPSVILSPEAETPDAESTQLPAQEEPAVQADALLTDDAEETVTEAAPQDTEPEETDSDAAAEEEEAASQEAQEDDEDFAIAFSGTTVQEAAEETEPAPRPVMPVRKKKRHTKAILTVLLTLLLVGCIGIAGLWLRDHFYLKTIDDLILEGTQDALTVTVDADMDLSLLQVTCTDTYGNSVVKPVVDGQAVFTDLLPDSLYRIEVTLDGFHQLTGKTAEIFTTDSLTNIVSMSAVIGSEDGSVMVNFTVDGADPDEWILTCRADGQETITETFTGHAVTVKGLGLGTTYTLELSRADGRPIQGQTTTEFSAGKLIMAENLQIADCVDGIMTVRWEAPADTAVEYWTVRCYNDDGHEEVLEIAGTEIAFTGIDRSKEYTVEVTAAGMTQPSRVSITADPLTITDLQVDSEDPHQLTVRWNYEGDAPEGGWLLMYTLDGNEEQPNVVRCETASAVIETRIPSARYEFTVQTADSTSVFNSIHSYTCPAADVFENQGLSANKITAHLLVTPEGESWSADALKDDDYTDTFHLGDSISVVLKANDNFYLPKMELNALYVIRDGNGNVLSRYVSEDVLDWKELWYAGDYHNGELTLPKVPEEPGDYSVSIYFNGLAVTATNFTILE